MSFMLAILLGVVDKQAGVGTDADRWLLVRKT